MHSFGRRTNDVRIVVICGSYFASIYVNIVTHVLWWLASCVRRMICSTRALTLSVTFYWH